MSILAILILIVFIMSACAIDHQSDVRSKELVERMEAKRLAKEKRKEKLC